MIREEEWKEEREEEETEKVSVMGKANMEWEEGERLDRGEG